jgi:hypothetical protein
MHNSSGLVSQINQFKILPSGPSKYEKNNLSVFTELDIKESTKVKVSMPVNFR